MMKPSNVFLKKRAGYLLGMDATRAIIGRPVANSNTRQTGARQTTAQEDQRVSDLTRLMQDWSMTDQRLMLLWTMTVESMQRSYNSAMAEEISSMMHDLPMPALELASALAHLNAMMGQIEVMSDQSARFMLDELSAMTDSVVTRLIKREAV